MSFSVASVTRRRCLCLLFDEKRHSAERSKLPRADKPRMTSIASVSRRRKLRWAAFFIPACTSRPAKARFPFSLCGSTACPPSHGPQDKIRSLPDLSSRAIFLALAPLPHHSDSPSTWLSARRRITNRFAAHDWICRMGETLGSIHDPQQRLTVLGPKSSNRNELLFVCLVQTTRLYIYVIYMCVYVYTKRKRANFRRMSTSRCRSFGRPRCQEIPFNVQETCLCLCLRWTSWLGPRIQWTGEHRGM